MKVLGPERERVAAVARRIAVALGLREVESEQRLANPTLAARAVLIDDLCGLSRAVDAASIADAELACAVADPDRATSVAARVAYAARLLLRASGVDLAEAASSRAHTAGVHRYPDLASAAVGLVRMGVSVAGCPRPLLVLLPEPGRQRGQLLLQLIASVYAHGSVSLARTLCTAPFHLDANELAVALHGQSGTPRGALAAAISSMTPNGTRERAIAALEVIDAVLEASASSQALSRSLQAAHEAIVAAHPFDGDQSALEAYIAAADRVFAAASAETKVGDRARLVSDALTSARIEGLELVPFVGSSGVKATLACEDAAAAVDVERFAQALGVERERLDVFLKPGPRALVSGSLTDVLTKLALQREAVIAARPLPRNDPATAVVSPGMTFSASRLNSYVKCSRRYFYEYLCEAIEDQASLHATYGRVVHDALEMLHREIRLPARHEQSSILERLLRDLDAAFGAARADFASQLEYESSRWRARRMAEQYVRWLCAEAKRAPMEIAAVEVFERRQLGEHDFIGYIDRLDRPEGGGAVTIYDYKTGRIDDDAKAYLAKVRSGDEAQLALYYAMRTAAGDTVKRIALVSVRDPRDEVWILALDVVPDGGEPVPSIDREAGVVRATCSPADLDASLDALFRRCDLLTKEGVARFAIGEDPPCGFCEYARACRDRPIHGERSFAR